MLFFFSRKATPLDMVSATPRERHDLFRVGAHLAREGEPVMLRRFAIGVYLCAFQQRLGRDAAPVEAYAARLGTLHECDLPSQLRSPDCGH